MQGYVCYFIGIASGGRAWASINKKRPSVLHRVLTVKILGLGFWRNRREITEVAVFAAIGDGFQVFGISAVGDADLNDLAEGNTIWNYKDF